MPGLRTLAHPRMRGQNQRQFFPETVRIEMKGTVTQAANGQEVITWVPRPGCKFVRATVTGVIRLGEEWRNWRNQFVLEQVTHMCQLDGVYPQIQADDRMVRANGEIHDIQSRHIDSHVTITRLHTRLKSPEAVPGL